MLRASLEVHRTSIRLAVGVGGACASGEQHPRGEDQGGESEHGPSPPDPRGSKARATVAAFGHSGACRLEGPARLTEPVRAGDGDGSARAAMLPSRAHAPYRDSDAAA